MAVSFLQTKLFVPIPWADPSTGLRARLILRPRLMKRLDERRRLTLVSAPAGFGKTTLVGAWVEALSAMSSPVERVAWLSLDAPDDDPIRFWSYIIVALQTIHPNIGETALTMLQMPQPPPVETVLAALLNEIAVLPDPLALVLDDYHLIKASAIHEALVFLLDHLPPQMRLVILTRADPPLPLARLRVRNQLTELRAADLRFTTDEAAAFLSRGMGLDLTADDVAALEARTEGWIAGLQLAALSMQGRTDVTDFIAAFAGSHHYVVDYLVQEVLDRQPVEVSEFLLRTSILDRLSGPLCDALTGRTGGQFTLEALERANLFVVPLDDGRRWYRYHHLFADMLRGKLRHVYPDQISDLHCRAAEWCEQNQLIDAAFTHALAANDIDRAARLFSTHWFAMISGRKYATSLRMIEALPQSVVRASPRLNLVYAHLLMSTGRGIDDYRPYIHDAERSLVEQLASGQVTGDDAEVAALHGEIDAFKAIFAMNQGELEAAARLTEKALSALPHDAMVVRGFTLTCQAIAYSEMGYIDEAIRACTRAIEVGRAGNNPTSTAQAVHTLVGLLKILGKLVQAADLCRTSLHDAASRGEAELAVYGLVHLAMAEILYEWNDLEEAERHINLSLLHTEQGGNIRIWLRSRTMQAMLSYARGHLQEALDVLQDTDLEAQKARIPSFAEILLPYRIKIFARQGNLDAVAEWTRRFNLQASDRVGARQGNQRLYYAQMLIALGRLEDALDQLTWLETYSELAVHLGWLIQVLVMRAMVWKQKGDMTQAVQMLEKALALAEPEGYMRMFLDEGEPMQTLLKASASHRDAVLSAYIHKLLAAFDEQSEHSSPALQPLIEPLSERELQVLRLLAEGRSNQDIGDELFIAVGTVKKHLSNIFGKLGVRNRTECAARARELGLI